LKLNLPNIKTPHFKLKNWSKNPLDWIRAMPSIDVQWYKKGGVFNDPSVIGVGEEPGVSEAVLPLKDSVLGKIGKMIANTMDSDFLLDKLNTVNSFMNPQLILSAVSEGVSKGIGYSDMGTEGITNNNSSITQNLTFNFEVKGEIDKKKMDEIANYTFKKITSGLQQMGRPINYI
jgi:hypothetical protein